MNLTVGVMGSADGPTDPEVAERVRRLGQAIAGQDCTLVTGACPGIPYAAALGAGEAGGLVVGISPALSEDEHRRRYDSPVDGFDVIVYTGSGLMGREVVAIRSSDVILVAGGRSGTLGEFAIAYDEGRLIGVLTGTGGVADAVEGLVKQIEKDTGAVIIYDDDPDRLVYRTLHYYRTVHYRRPNCFTDGGEPPAGSAAAQSA